MEITQPTSLNTEIKREEILKKIARSNFLLFEIRKLLNLKAEYFSKWDQVGKAFNGAFLYADSETPLTSIYFHDDKQFFIEGHQQLKIDDILVSISNEISDIDWNNLLNIANDSFDKLLREKNDLFLSQVSRLLLYIGYWEKEQELNLIKDFIDRICSEFSHSTIYPIQQSMPGYSDGILHEFNLEIVLSKPISESKFLDILKNYLPNLQEPIFGYGYRKRNPIPNMDFWITLYARQF